MQAVDWVRVARSYPRLIPGQVQEDSHGVEIYLDPEAAAVQGNYAMGSPQYQDPDTPEEDYSPQTPDTPKWSNGTLPDLNRLCPVPRLICCPDRYIPRVLKAKLFSRGFSECACLQARQGLIEWDRPSQTWIGSIDISDCPGIPFVDVAFRCFGGFPFDWRVACSGGIVRPFTQNNFLGSCLPFKVIFELGASVPPCDPGAVYTDLEISE